MAEILIVSCSGASNTGTLADRVAREIIIDNEGDVEMLCLPALALGRKNAVQKVKSAEKIIVIDGCQGNCAKQLLEKAGASADVYYELTKDFNVKKSKVPVADEEELEEIKKKIREFIEV